MENQFSTKHKDFYTMNFNDQILNSNQDYFFKTNSPFWTDQKIVKKIEDKKFKFISEKNISHFKKEKKKYFRNIERKIKSIKKNFIQNYITVKSEYLKKIEKGWLIKKFDSGKKNKILVNTIESINLLSFDLKKKSFFSKRDLKFSEKLFNSCIFKKKNENMIIYNFFNENFLEIYDYNKEKNFQKIYREKKNCVTILKSFENLLFSGDINSKINIFDIRSGEKIFTEKDQFFSNFNPIINLEIKNNYFLFSNKNRVDLVDLRMLRKNNLLYKKNISSKFGINIAHFFSDKENDFILFSQIGKKSIKIFNLKNNRKESKEIVIDKNILNFKISEKSFIFVLKGSENMEISLFKKNFKNQNNFSVDKNTLDFGLFKDNFFFTFGSKKINVFKKEGNFLDHNFPEILNEIQPKFY